MSSNSETVFELPEAELRTFGQSNDWGSRSHFLLLGQSGRIWMVSTGDDLNVAIESTHVATGQGEIPADGIPLKNARIAILDDDDLLTVWEVHNGTVLVRIRAEGGYCFDPSGRYLIVFDDEVATLHDLDTTPAEATIVTDWHSPPPSKDGGSGGSNGAGPFLDSPGSAAAAGTPDSAGQFHLVVGCYGYVVSWKSRLVAGQNPKVGTLAPPTIFAAGMVYDPVSIVQAGPGPIALANHGYGAGLAALNLESGAQIDCPLPDRQRYAFFPKLC